MNRLRLSLNFFDVCFALDSHRAFGSTSYGFDSSEVHSKFGVQKKAKVLKLVDLVLVDRVRARSPQS